MPIDTHPARMRGRTPEQIMAQQKEDAAKERARVANAQTAAATSTVTNVAVEGASCPGKNRQRQHRGGDAGHQDERASLYRRDCASWHRWNVGQVLPRKAR